MQAASEAAEREELQHVSRVVAVQAEQITPKLRVALPASVYQAYAHRVFADMRDELQLRAFGVVRLWLVISSRGMPLGNLCHGKVAVIPMLIDFLQR